MSQNMKRGTFQQLKIENQQIKSNFSQGKMNVKIQIEKGDQQENGKQKEQSKNSYTLSYFWFLFGLVMFIHSVPMVWYTEQQSIEFIKLMQKVKKQCQIDSDFSDQNLQEMQEEKSGLHYMNGKLQYEDSCYDDELGIHFRSCLVVQRKVEYYTLQRRPGFQMKCRKFFCCKSPNNDISQNYERAWTIKNSSIKTENLYQQNAHHNVLDDEDKDEEEEVVNHHEKYFLVNNVEFRPRSVSLNGITLIQDHIKNQQGELYKFSKSEKQIICAKLSQIFCKQELGENMESSSNGDDRDDGGAFQSGEIFIDDEYIYIKNRSQDNRYVNNGESQQRLRNQRFEVGDQRISYNIVRADLISIVAGIRCNFFSPYDMTLKEMELQENIKYYTQSQLRENLISDYIQEEVSEESDIFPSQRTSTLSDYKKMYGNHCFCGIYSFAKKILTINKSVYWIFMRDQSFKQCLQDKENEQQKYYLIEKTIGLSGLFLGVVFFYQPLLFSKQILFHFSESDVLKKSCIDQLFLAIFFTTSLFAFLVAFAWMSYQRRIGTISLLIGIIIFALGYMLV